MKRTVAIGIQDFETLRTENWFYLDKTDFIRRWWNQGERERADVKLWYDGFTFGGITDIYNPWSVIISRPVYASVCGTGMICRGSGFDHRFRE